MIFRLTIFLRSIAGCQPSDTHRVSRFALHPVNGLLINFHFNLTRAKLSYADISERIT
jgi:hypothetical protein